MHIPNAILLPYTYFVTFLVLLISGESSWEDENASFDHFVFTQFWAPQSCKDLGRGCRFSRLPPIWTVHGLWPSEGSSTKMPAYCGGEEFNPDLLSDMRSSMDAYWFTYLQGQQNSDFWRHEWRRHGTCAVAGETKIFPSQKSYFSLIIQDLYRKYNISYILESAGISTGSRYSVEKLQGAFNPVLGGHLVGLMCTEDCINAIEICLDRDLDPITCKHHSCPDSGYLNYPVYQ